MVDNKFATARRAGADQIAYLFSASSRSAL